MKFVKLSVLALSMGLFVASCGNGSNSETPKTDTPTAQQATPPATPPAAPAADSTAAPKADSATAPKTEEKK